MKSSKECHTYLLYLPVMVSQNQSNSMFVKTEFENSLCRSLIKSRYPDYPEAGLNWTILVNENC